MNLSAPSASVVPSSAAPKSSSPKLDLYGPPHKMIRFLLANVMLDLGRTSFGDEAQAAAVMTKMEEALQVCDGHIAHEDQFVRPALAERAPTSIATLDAEHAEHALQVAELRGLARALAAATTPEARIEVGQTIYLHFTVFVAETLAHAAYEERVIQPLALRLFSFEELMGIHGAIMASMPPAEMMLSMRAMIPASNREERALMLGGLRAQAGDGPLQGVLQLISDVLSPADMADLRARLGVA